LKKFLINNIREVNCKKIRNAYIYYNGDYMLKILLISIPFLFILGSVLHFAYNFTNKNKLVGLFSPVNESIFEHSKLLLTPLTLFWIMLYFFKENSVDINNYFFAMLISIVTSIIVMISFYYTYEGVLGKNKELLNILDLLISLTIGQILANHIYVYSKGIPAIISIILVLIIFILFIYFTYKPLKIPLFIDKKNKTLGIKEEKLS